MEEEEERQREKECVKDSRVDSHSWGAGKPRPEGPGLQGAGWVPLSHPIFWKALCPGLALEGQDDMPWGVPGWWG